MKYNAFDDNEYRAFVFNESKIVTDDSEPEEHTPESIFGLDTDCMGNCFSDADAGL